MAIWEKLNQRERMSAIGAALIVLAWVLSLVSYGLGAGTLVLLGAIAVGVILYLKYAPNMTINWPAPTSLLIGAISALVALLALIDVLTSLRWVGVFGATATLALILEAIGAGLMAWGAWQEYQIVKPPLPAWLASSMSGSGTSATPPPAAPPSAPPAAPPPAADDHPDEMPPA